MTPQRVAILGAGRVGGALHRGLSAAGHPPVLLWTRSASTAAAAQAEGFPAVTGPLPAIDADIVLLAVEDTAVSPLAGALRDVRAGVVAHTAGALDLTALAALTTAVGSFHPIVSVATRSTSLQGQFAAIASTDAAADERLSWLASTLGMGVVRPTGDRARYHAAAAIVGNFPQALLEASIRLLTECGLSRDEARQAFGQLLTGAAENAARLGPAEGLTGPVVRGDLATVDRHLQAIPSSPDIERLYRAASLIATELAATRGAPNIEALRTLLQR